MPPKLVIMCGLPGSGKTTHCRRVYTHWVSTDEIRQELGKGFDRSSEGRVWATAYRQLRKAMAEGWTVAFDATNVDCRSRAGLIKLAREYNATIRVEWLDTPLEECLKRNAARVDPVPEQVILGLAAKFQPPTTAEGIDEIAQINS